MSTCTFFGHWNTPDKVEEPLKNLPTFLINEKGVNNFYVGNQGGFDRIVKKVLDLLKKDYPQITYSVVLAYLNVKCESDIQRERYKDSIYPEGLEKTPPRFAIYKRNLWMIEKSDIVVTYVKNVGGAATFKEISEKKGKTVFNITL